MRIHQAKEEIESIHRNSTQLHSTNNSLIPMYSIHLMSTLYYCVKIYEVDGGVIEYVAFYVPLISSYVACSTTVSNT